MSNSIQIGALASLSIKALEISSLQRREPNPHGTHVYKEVYQTAQKMGLIITPANYSDHVTMSAYLWPHTSAERLRVLAFFNTLGYYLNDKLGPDVASTPDIEVLRTTTIEKAHAILIEGCTPAPSDYYDQAFIYLRKAILALSNRKFARRFFPLLLQHWRGDIRGYDPYEGTIQEYIAARRQSAGMLPTIALIEFAADCYMPEWLPLAVPSLDIAANALADIGGISNDIFSFAKESHSTYNIVRVIERECEYDNPVLAINEVFEFVNRSYQIYQASLDTIQSEVYKIGDRRRKIVAEQFLESYLAGLLDELAACYFWQIETNRFRHGQHPIADLQTRLEWSSQEKVG